MIATITISAEELEELKKLPNIANVIYNEDASVVRLVRESELRDYLKTTDAKLWEQLLKSWTEEKILKEFAEYVDFVIGDTKQTIMLSDSIEDSLDSIFELAFRDFSRTYNR